jgi:hypothetical protein
MSQFQITIEELDFLARHGLVNWPFALPTLSNTEPGADDVQYLGLRILTVRQLIRLSEEGQWTTTSPLTEVTEALASATRLLEFRIGSHDMAVEDAAPLFSVMFTEGAGSALTLAFTPLGTVLAEDVPVSAAEELWRRLVDNFAARPGEESVPWFVVQRDRLGGAASIHVSGSTARLSNGVEISAPGSWAEVEPLIALA